MSLGPGRSTTQVHELIAPAPESVKTVTDWLLAAGVPESSITKSLSGDWVTATVPVSVAEVLVGQVCSGSLLHLYIHAFSVLPLQKYHVFAHDGLNQTLLRLNGEYTLPEDVAKHLVRHLLTCCAGRRGC